MLMVTIILEELTRLKCKPLGEISEMCMPWGHLLCLLAENLVTRLITYMQQVFYDAHKLRLF